MANSERIEPAEPIKRRMYTVREVSAISGLPAPTVYMKAAQNPSEWGRVKVGRTVRLRRDVVDAKYPPPEK